jgi:hypothetical protein
LPILGKELAQLPGVDLPLFLDCVIVSFHGGSPFRFGNPIPIKESGGTAAQLSTTLGEPSIFEKAIQSFQRSTIMRIIHIDELPGARCVNRPYHSAENHRMVNNHISFKIQMLILAIVELAAS